MNALFQNLARQVASWSRHRHAEPTLAGLSFIESSFFPIPPEAMLMPMALSNPQRTWRYAFLVTVFSVLGGMVGYTIGLFAFNWVAPIIQDWGYWDAYLQAQNWFDEWGFWAIFIAGFSPIPYKVFTITAGSMSMAFLPFVIASLIGRGLRFYLVAALCKWGGSYARSPEGIRRLKWIGWGSVIAAILIYLFIA